MPTGYQELCAQDGLVKDHADSMARKKDFS